MKSLLFHSMILSLCLVIATSKSTSETAKKHVDLIEDVRKNSKSSSIMLMSFFTDHDNLWKMDLFFNMQMLLSRDKIMTSNLNFDPLHFSEGSVKRAKVAYTRRSDHTMLVFVITSAVDLFRMKQINNWLIQHEMIDLVLFLRTITYTNSAVDVCKTPQDNPLLLKKGTSLLVKCHEDPVIQEWHALNKRKMAIYERATWEPRTGLILKSKKLVSSDEDKLNGKVLNVASSMYNSPATKEFLDDLMGILETAGNFSVKYFVDPENLNGIDYYRGPYLIAPRSYRSEYSEELWKYECVLAIRRPERKTMIQWSAYFQPFELDVWIALVLLLIAIQVIRVFMKTKLQIELGNEESVEDDPLYVFGIYFQQGLPEFPKASSLRIFYCTGLISAFLLMSMYSAAFVCELTRTVETLPFNSLEEFVKVKSHKLIVRVQVNTYQDLKHATTFPWKEAGDLLVPENENPTTDELAIRMVCQENVAFYTHSHVIRKYGNICSLINIKIGQIDSTAMMTKINSPISRPMNQILKKLKNGGIMQRLESEYGKKLELMPPVPKPREEYPSVSLLDMIQLFTFFCGSIVFSIIVFLFEKLHFCFKRMRRVETQKLSRPLAGYLRPRKKALKAVSYDFGG